MEGRALAQRSVECLNGRRQKWREWLLGAAKQGWSLRGAIDESHRRRCGRQLRRQCALRHEYRPSADLSQDYELKVAFPAGRLGEADLEQIWRSPDQSALLVGGRLLVLGPVGGGQRLVRCARERLKIVFEKSAACVS